MATYTFHVISTSEAVDTWLLDAKSEDLSGTLAQALELSKNLDSPVTLYNAACDRKGRVEPDGTYRLGPV